MRIEFKAYVTKYALTHGIRRVELQRHTEQPSRTAYGYFGGIYTFFTEENYHKTRRDAVRKAKRMFDEKMKSLKQELVELRKKKLKL